jgi:hypothetical protein
MSGFLDSVVHQVGKENNALVKLGNEEADEEQKKKDAEEAELEASIMGTAAESLQGGFSEPNRPPGHDVLEKAIVDKDNARATKVLKRFGRKLGEAGKVRLLDWQHTFGKFSGMNLLMIACQRDNAGAASLLLKAGANPNLRQKLERGLGDSALHIAIKRYQVEPAVALCAANADVWQKNYKKQTCVEYSRIVHVQAMTLTAEEIERGTKSAADGKSKIEHASEKVKNCVHGSQGFIRFLGITEKLTFSPEYIGSHSSRPDAFSGDVRKEFQALERKGVDIVNFVSEEELAVYRKAFWAYKKEQLMKQMQQDTGEGAKPAAIVANQAPETARAKSFKITKNPKVNPAKPSGEERAKSLKIAKKKATPARQF